MITRTAGYRRLKRLRKIDFYRRAIHAAFCIVVVLNARSPSCFQTSNNSPQCRTIYFFRDVISKIATAIVVCASMASCAQQRTITLEAAPKDLFEQTAPITIRGSHTIANRHGRVVSGALEGIGTGMKQGAIGSLVGGASTGNFFAAALGVVLMPVFAVGGGVTGGVLAHSSDETKTAIKAIEHLYNDDTFLNLINGKIKKRLTLMSFPEVVECKDLDEIKTPDTNSSTAVPSSQLCRLKDQANTLKIKTIYSFFTQGVYSPDLRFGIDVEAIVANADRKKIAREFRWIYLAPSLDFFTATAEDAAALRQKIESAQDLLVEAIVDDLLIARHSVTVVGQYFPNRQGVNFIPGSISPGVVRRMPTQSQLHEVPELENKIEEDTMHAHNMKTGGARPKSDIKSTTSKKQSSINTKMSFDKIEIRRAIENFLDINMGGSSCWGNMMDVPSAACTVYEVQGISVKEVEKSKILVTGRYVLEAQLERRSFVSNFVLVQDNKRLRVIEMRPI